MFGIQNCTFRSLRNASVEFKKGEFVALVGVCGSGKSTLLKVLAGILVPSCEYRVWNSQRIPAGFRHNFGIKYLPQVNQLCHNLTVRQTLSYAVSLRVVEDTPGLCNIAFDRIVEVGDLTEYLDTFISDLSVGLRQRVSVAIRFIGNPGVLLCDEPISSLDSDSALNIMTRLRTKATEGDGMVVVCVVHQASPQILRLFHRVLTLDKGQILPWAVDGLETPPGEDPAHAQAPKAKPEEEDEKAHASLRCKSSNHAGIWEKPGQDFGVDTSMELAAKRMRPLTCTQLKVLVVRAFLMSFDFSMSLADFGIGMTIGLIFWDQNSNPTQSSIFATTSLIMLMINYMISVFTTTTARILVNSYGRHWR